MAKTMTERIVELMKTPDKIRNIATIAHIDHGKCVKGNSRVMLADGSFINAEELFNRTSENGDLARKDDNETVYSPKKVMNVFSLNKEKGIIEYKKIDYAWKLKGGKLIKIKLRDGSAISTTPEHRYIIPAENGFIEKEARELKIGDRVVCAKNLLFDSKHNNLKFESANEGQLGTVMLKLKKTAKGDLAYIEITAIEQDYADEVYDFTISDNHNFIAEGMVIHNTTFSDNLLAGAGMISQEWAGKQLFLDFKPDEQARGITIDAANVSMVHELKNSEFLINLIDTPGHVDFGGDVTRAMRAIDGAIVLVDAVEGVMPQTETVLRQALKERVRPVLFINKSDRLIKELKLTPQQMQERFIKIIMDVNRLIKELADEDFKEKWQVNVNEGSVAFGSAFHNWALSIPYMKEKGISFADVIDAYESNDQEKIKALAKRAPLHLIVLNMVVDHHPNPVQAQAYRIPKIWRGDVDSELGKALINCDPNGPVAFVCTKIVIDKHAGEVAAGRLFSGTVYTGQEVRMLGAKHTVRLQQVSVYNGAKREIVERAFSGNVIGLVGLKNVFSGETITTDPNAEPFEEIKHIFEPVVTKAIEAAKPSELPKLVEVLRQVNKEDPTITIEINEETGEHLMSGLGELHLEIKENRIKTEKGIDIKTSNPIVVFRETVTKTSPEVESRTPNKHNVFIMKVEPLTEAVHKVIKEGKVNEGRIKKKDEALWKALQEAGMETKETRQVKDVYKGNMLLDQTRGIVHIGEVMELVMDGFEEVMRKGPLANEPATKLKVSLMDTKLHEDAIHRGPAQVLPAIRDGVRTAMVLAGPVIYEPMQIMQFEAPEKFMGELSKLIQNRRGQLLDMRVEGSRVVVMAKLPVAEMFGMTSDLRGATEGRGAQFLVDQLFERLPGELQERIVGQIRQRKGLKVVEGVAVPDAEAKKA